MHKLILLVCLISGSWLSSFAFNNYTVEVKDVSFNGLPGLQSFTHGAWDGKWLLIGGRTDGLHQRQPFAAFLASDNNLMIYVIDPVAENIWSMSLDSLPTGMKEQLQSTNMEFEQRDSTLYIIGGYGYSATEGDHYTFPNLTAVNVPLAINAVMNSGSIQTYFRQITDNRIQVTGGYLDRLGNEFYLVGGQKFIGRYNPMGPTHGPGFVQEYTESIKCFGIEDDGTNMVIVNYTETKDSANLHRRDYNMAPQIFPDGSVGFTVFSGVFQHTVDLPWLNTVDIRQDTYTVVPGFNQYLNQYHSAHASLYEAKDNRMHSLFFGGISRYYMDAAGTMVDDQNVPFVNTISLVSRASDGSMTESKIGEMPDLLGSGAEFFPNPKVSMDSMGILEMDQFSGDSVLIGHIYGGIVSSAANIFFSNTGSQSDASDKLFEVWLKRTDSNSTSITAIDADAYFLPSVYPNPAQNGQLSLSFMTRFQAQEVNISILDTNGRLVLQKTLWLETPGRQLIRLNIDALASGTYIVQISNTQFKFRERWVK